MLQNYEYFLALAETQNISRAAEKLFISHQCLSRYLKTLEKECGVTLFERKPSFSITHAGEMLLQSFRDIQQIEQNASRSLEELKCGETGIIRLGITESRLRILFPELLRIYQPLHPNILIKTTGAYTVTLVDLLLENKLDFAIGSTISRFYSNLSYNVILEEDMYLVISDNMLKKSFPNSFPACKAEFAKGVDLRLLSHVPFCVAERDYNSRRLINNHLLSINASLNIIHESNQPDLLHILAANDYCASFALSTYLPNIAKLNRNAPPDNQLNIFPIKGFHEKNPIFLIKKKDLYYPEYIESFFKIVIEQSQHYQNYQLKFNT